MWETMTDEIIAGSAARCASNRRSTELEVRDGRIVARRRPATSASSRGEVISSLPLRATVGIAGPPRRRGAVQTAAQGLRYRDFLTVALVIDGEDLFPDNWIYIHEPGRVTSAASRTTARGARGWSRIQTKACVGLEYFCFKGDELWTSHRRRPRRAGQRELEQLGLARADKVERGFVTRVPKAYPMYDEDYSERVDVDQGLARPG